MTQTLMLHGQFENLSSFALVNRQLAAGLGALGYHVVKMPSDSVVTQETAGAAAPDIYLAHDYPYDMLDAPGRVNAFLLEYDYARVLKRDAPLVERLNHFFDVVLVPSEFVRAVCHDSGVQIPIVVCPLGIDPSEFNPNIAPLALPTTKRFKFLFLGGVNERKGTDLLLRAYANEFRASDDVVLVVKAFGYPHLRAEFENLLARVRERAHAPEIFYEYGTADSIAGYYTAADCGVFPFRGEGFALPILEAIACGCPVIVTEGGGPRDYCDARNATFVSAKQVTYRGKIRYAPDVAELQRRMREAYERGARSLAERQSIGASVAAWTWQRTIAQVHAALQKHLQAQPVPQRFKPIQVSYAFYEKGETSWKKEARQLDHALARKFTYVPLNFRAAPLAKAVDVVLGESGFALEHFLRAARLNPAVKRILRRSSAPFETMVVCRNRERELCGLPPLVFEPLEYWRNTRESALADEIIVPGRASQRLFLEGGYSADKVRVIPLGMPAPQPVRPRRARILRFLFVATDPFRKGIRLLFEAWDALQPHHAELVCIAGQEIFGSPLLLRYLVRNPTITVKPFMPPRKLKREYLNSDCQVLPSLEDGFSVAVADGMTLGKPAIVSTETGIADTLTHLENGYLVPAGSVTKLKQALAYFCTHRASIAAMGAAAQETAHAYSYARYQQAIVDLIQSHLSHV